MDHLVWIAMDTAATLATEATELGDSFLSAVERTRLAAISGVRRQVQFRAGRLLMRRLLARVHGGDALHDWPLTAAIDAPPSFIGQAFAQRPGARLHLSISHSGRYVCCAASASRVGIDMEMARSRQRDVLGMAEALCNEEEFAHLVHLGDADRQSYFLSLWTLKEAALKCEAGRLSTNGMRRFATRETSFVDAVPDPIALPRIEARARGPVAASTDPDRAGAWVWQCTELTLSVVSEGTGEVPRWALPPPDFMLPAPRAWAIRVTPAGNFSRAVP